MTAADIFLTSMTERTLRHIADVHTPAFTSVRRMRNCRRAVSVGPSARPSAVFVYCIETSKHILKPFPPIGRSTILLFPYQMLWQSDEDLVKV